MPRARLAALALVVLAVAACAGTGRTATPGASTPSPDITPGTPSASPESTPTAASDAPSAAIEPSPSEEPEATGEPTSTDEPVATDPVSSPAPTADDDATPTPGIAAACSGSDDNREFYGHVAAAVDWPVYCAVLPKGWFVSTGSYRLAGGGKLEIAYTGPGGATIALSQGAFCAQADGCVPSGAEIGSAAFGPRQASLVRLDDGGFAVVAARGARPSWLLVTDGLDQAQTVAIAAALREVSD